MRVARAGRCQGQAAGTAPASLTHHLRLPPSLTALSHCPRPPPAPTYNTLAGHCTASPTSRARQCACTLRLQAVRTHRLLALTRCCSCCLSSSLLPHLPPASGARSGQTWTGWPLVFNVFIDISPVLYMFAVLKHLFSTHWMRSGCVPSPSPMGTLQQAQPGRPAVL
jgi:hypothetical protein